MNNMWNVHLYWECSGNMFPEQQFQSQSTQWHSPYPDSSSTTHSNKRRQKKPIVPPMCCYRDGAVSNSNCPHRQSTGIQWNSRRMTRDGRWRSYHFRSRRLRLNCCYKSVNRRCPSVLPFRPILRHHGSRPNTEEWSTRIHRPNHETSFPVRRANNCANRSSLTSYGCCTHPIPSPIYHRIESTKYIAHFHPNFNEKKYDRNSSQIPTGKIWIIFNQSSMRFQIENVINSRSKCDYQKEVVFAVIFNGKMSMDIVQYVFSQNPMDKYAVNMIHWNTFSWAIRKEMRIESSCIFWNPFTKSICS